MRCSSGARTPNAVETIVAENAGGDKARAEEVRRKVEGISDTYRASGAIYGDDWSGEFGGSGPTKNALHHSWGDRLDPEQIRETMQTAPVMGTGTTPKATIKPASPAFTPITIRDKQYNSPNEINARIEVLNKSLAKINANPRASTDFGNSTAYREELSELKTALRNPREKGGRVQSGKAHLVGESEAEVFVPDRNGMILNQETLDRMTERRNNVSYPAMNSGRESNLNTSALFDTSPLGMLKNQDTKMNERLDQLLASESELATATHEMMTAIQRMLSAEQTRRRRVASA